MEDSILLDILKKRYDLAKKFTEEKYINQVKRSIKDYEAEDIVNDTSTVTNRHQFNVNDRYEMKIPMIFTNTEAMKAALFERLPDLVIKGRGSDDEEKKEIVDAAYEYLKDKLNLFDVADQAAHWFILTGFCSAQANFESRGREVPVLDEAGQPMLDKTGQPVTEVEYDYNDPVIDVLDPKKTFFALDSKFDYKAQKTPYFFMEKLMSPEEIKTVYNKEVEADTTLVTNEEEADLGDSEEKQDTVKDMVNVRFYVGELPYSNKEELTEWDITFDPYKVYFIIHTETELLYVTEKRDKYLRLCKWYGQPTDFFGFGLGKIGHTFQLEKTIRRGQQIRLADAAAYFKWAVKSNDDINEMDLTDPRSPSQVVKYKDTKPEILQPGNMADIVSVNSNEADQDAQRAFGILDLNTGAQASTVDTATGQTIFAQAASRRIEFAKKKFMAFYRELVICLLKLCQENWDEEKVASIIGQDGKEKQVTLSKESLQDIDFDHDIDIDMETLSVNKDVLRQQYIAMYDKTKDDPLIERKNVIADMFARGFEVKDPDRYIKDNNLQPGAILINQQTGEQYQVDDNGEVVSAEQTQNLTTPSTNQTPVSSSMEDVLQSVPQPTAGMDI